MTYPQYHNPYAHLSPGTGGRVTQSNPLTRNHKIALGIGAGVVVLGGGFLAWHLTRKSTEVRTPQRTSNP